MREIKFRAISYFGDWVYGLISKGSFSFDQDKQLWLMQEWGVGMTPIEFETIGQYTGLKDKNSKEIYEGDVLSWVQFNMNMTCMWDVNRTRITLKSPNGVDDIGLTIFNQNEFEVIGNIHENPELLEASNG